jgi:glycosyltransferase involved in cell wall biosynthesis
MITELETPGISKLEQTTGTEAIRRSNALISIVVPVYNEEQVLPALHERLTEVLPPIAPAVEVIFVNDGSMDRSAEMIDSICAADSRFKALHFSRNFGHQAAVTAGLSGSTGDCVVVLDADLQDPPELIAELLDKWRSGYDVVYAQRISREGEGFLKKTTAFLFYRVLHRISDLEPPPDTGDFCLMDRKVVNVLNSMPERQPYLRGLRVWVGFRQTAVPFERKARFAGTTKYPVRKLFSLAVDGMLGMSKVPLRLAMYLGLMVSAFSFLLGAFYLIQHAIGTDSAPRGWASTVVLILFLGGIQLVCIGVIGEFIGRIYDEVKERPRYIISRSTGF